MLLNSNEEFFKAKCIVIPTCYSYHKWKLPYRKTNQAFRALSNVGPSLLNSVDKYNYRLAELLVFSHFSINSTSWCVRVIPCFWISTLPYIEGSFQCRDTLGTGACYLKNLGDRGKIWLMLHNNPLRLPQLEKDGLCNYLIYLIC